MGKFTDRHNREWTVDVTVGAIERVRSLAGVNLYRAMDDGMRLLGEITEDPGRRVAVLYAVCKPQIDQRGETPEGFGESFAGESIDAAWMAFLDSLADFFPDARHRQQLKRFLGQCRALREKAIDLMAKLSAEKMDEVDRMLDPSTSRNSAGNSPESPESTPGP